MRQLERDVEKRLGDIAGLLDVAPRGETIERVRRALSAEAARIGRRQSLMAITRACAGAAAAILLALGLALPRTPTPSDRLLALDDSPEAAFADWVDALDESGAQFTRLLDDGWILDSYGVSEEEAEFDGDPLDSLEESFDALEQVIGA